MSVRDIIQAAAGVGGAAPTDPNFKQTTLLLHGDGTNGAQNNTFLDGSTNNFTITRNGNTTQGTFSPFSLAAGEWSNYFDGTGDYLSIPSNAAFAFGTGAYTVEAWVYLTAFDSDESVVFGSASASGGFGFVIYPTGAIGVAKYGTGLIAGTGTGVVSLNTWIHIAVSRANTSSNGIKFFVNGSLVTTTTDAENWSVSSSPIVGGWSNLSTYDITGYLSNVRVVKGTAVYTSAFTPSTTPLTAISNTSLLTCQSNRFVDNSTNAFAITRNGDVRVTPFSPFAPTAAYSAATNGGSGYFDGTGDYLSVARNTAFIPTTGDFTVEAWVYVSALQTSMIGGLQESGTAADWSLFLVNDGTITFFIGSTVISYYSTATYKVGQWNHVMVCRSGSTLYLGVNGVANSTTATGSLNNNQSYPLTIGADQNGDESLFTGYISGWRFLNGSAAYPSTTYTVPTAPPTAITNTSLLCNFTNAGIFDQTGKNNLETVGNAQIDTTIKKFGTGSLEFDGTGDWLLLPASPDMAMGTGDFTFECWIYATAASDSPVYDSRSTNSNTNGFTVTAFSSTVIRVYTTTVLVTATVSNYLNTWVHVAFTRSGSTNRLFINGNLENTATASDNFSNQVAIVGGGRYGGGAGSTTITNSFTGYIDDLRITKGIARYTANFTPPTAAFPNL